MNSFIFFFKIHEVTGIHDIKVTGNTSITWFRWGVNIFTNYVVNQLNDAGKSVGSCTWVSCTACGFTVFYQRKCRENEKEKKKEKEWHLDGIIFQVQVLPVFYTEVPCTRCSVEVFEHLILHLLLRGAQTSWDGWNLPNKQFQ